MTDRGRIPFALIGVLLLLSSAILVATEHGTPAREPAVDEALDELGAAAQTAVRSGVRAAARRAAARPVLHPANSTVGTQLDPDRPFVDALRLRIYRRVRSRLAGLQDRRRGLAVSATLPPIDRPAAAARAIDRVSVEPAGSNDTAIRVRIRGIALRAERNGRTVGRASPSPTLVVETPVLFVHERVERFERQLNAPLVEPGFARRLTAGLYPVAWARGYAQFRGLPIENVVANDHLELLANGAVLSLQRTVFGRADRVGRRVYAETIGETVVTEFLGTTDSGALERLERLRTRTERLASAGETLPWPEPSVDVPDRGERTTVGLDRIADIAFLQASNRLNRTLAASYRPRVRVRATVERVDRTTRRDPRPREARERLSVESDTRTTVWNRSSDPPSAAAGWHPLLEFGRTVTVRTRRVSRWALSGNETATSSRTETATYTVDIMVAGNHTVGPAPDRPIRTVHEPAGALDGRNLADVRALARDVVARRGGADRLAERAVDGTLETESARVDAAVPAGLAARARPGLRRLRRRVGNVSVRVRRDRIASFEANVPRLLAERLRERRDRFVDAPATYSAVPTRSRTGVRAAYVDRVLDRLDRAAAAHDRGRGALGTRFPGTKRPASQLLSAGRTARRPAGNDAPPMRMHVAASPAYLTLQAVDGVTLDGPTGTDREHPLVARNVNGFTVPAADVVDALYGLLPGEDTTSVRSAVQVLRVANRLGADPANASAVKDDIGETLYAYRVASARTLARFDLGTRRSRASVVAEGLDRWAGPVARAHAVTNGSAAAAIRDAAIDRWPGTLSSGARNRLAVDLATTADSVTAAESAKPAMAAVDATLGELASELAASDVVPERAAALAARLPSGLPVLPTPGLWYATVNTWHVQVRGTYARFVVRVPRGAPDQAPADFRYVRENRTVVLDVDGDGHAERLGRNSRIAFRGSTAVGVAVPPQPAGVGDADERDERSPGWPDPGPVDE